jgi:DNA-binding HxlR family transcriptional regulator
MSSSVLYERLTELGDAGLIERDADGNYTLTLIGITLGAALAPLDQWSKDWASAQNNR